MSRDPVTSSKTLALAGAARTRPVVAHVVLAALTAIAGVSAPACSSDETEPVPAPPCTQPAGPFRPLSTRCQHLVDADGRVVVLRGVNMRIAGVFDADLGPGKVPLMAVPDLAPDDLATARRIGFDVIRLPIHWSAIEPEDATPPRYDAVYLDRVAAVVAAAHAAGLSVLLDLHQDAYSKYIGQDGAPMWAIAPPPEKVLEGPLTDLSTRVTSEQVQKAFATFFDRGPEIGKRLRARFGAMLAEVAKRFRDAPGVIGIDLYNEPVTGDPPLRLFHEEMGAAVRGADASRLLFFEPPGLRNLVDRGAIPDAPLGLAGVVYAPHVYTHAFTQGDDSAWRSTFTIDDLRPSNESARAEAEGFAAPLFIGEYGWDPRGIRYDDYIGMQLDLQDELMASSAYWVWKESSEGSWGFFDRDEAAKTWRPRPAAFAVFRRVRPRAISGWPERWSWSRAARTFELRTIGDPAVTAPTVLHLPEGARWAVTCDGRDVPSEPDARGDLAVACGGPGRHVVTARPR